MIDFNNKMIGKNNVHFVLSYIKNEISSPKALLSEKKVNLKDDTRKFNKQNNFFILKTNRILIFFQKAGEQLSISSYIPNNILKNKNTSEEGPVENNYISVSKYFFQIDKVYDLFKNKKYIEKIVIKTYEKANSYYQT